VAPHGGMRRSKGIQVTSSVGQITRIIACYCRFLDVFSSNNQTML